MRESVPSGVRMPVLVAAFAGASVVWALLLPIAPYLGTRPHASVPGSVLVFAIYGIGHLICHQLPERSFHLWGAQLPVCARCTGIYLGAAIAVCVAAGIVEPSTRYRARRLAAHRFGGAGLDAAFARRAVILAVLPTAVTLAYEWIAGAVPGNLIRAAAGLPLGVVGAWLVLEATSPGAGAENQVN